MHIGLMNNPANDPIGEIRWIGDNQFDFVDLTLEPPYTDADQMCAIAGSIRSELTSRGLGVVTHTPFWLMSFISPFASIRHACLGEFMKLLHATDEVGAKLMTVHSCRGPRLCSQQDIINYHLDVFGPLSEAATKMGITIAIENTFASGNQLEIIEGVLEAAPLIGFHLDSGHCNLENGDRWDEYIEKLGSKLVHVHLCENDGQSDQHLPLGTTKWNFDWPTRIQQLKLLGYDRTITLEVFSEKEYLLLNKGLLRQWWQA